MSLPGVETAAATATRWAEHHVPNYASPQIELTWGSGATVYDTAGRGYLDLIAGIAVNILGHNHPAIVAAVTRQVARLAHVSNLYASDVELDFVERLAALTGGRKALLVTSGAEANEAALKILRRHAHREGMPEGVVVAFDKSFHGRTLGALALTGQPAHQEGFTPLPGQVVHVPYNDPAALEAAFDAHRVAGVFAEYVQGEGGVRPMTQDCADTIQRIARASNALVVADEVQTGVARTGRFLASEHYGAKPDVVTLAKALGGGMPVGACLVAPRHANLLPPGSHGCTFGGNPVCVAAATAVLETVVREDLAARAAHLGALLQERLADALPAHEPRGLGLLVGLPLGAPVAPDVLRRLVADGVLAGQAGKDVLRLAPPLVIDEDELVDAVPVVARAVQAATKAT